MNARKLAPLLLVIAAALWAYHDVFRAAFVFDDKPHILENPHIRQLWPPWDVLSHSSRPAVDLSLAVNYALGGLNPWGYHLFNVVVHILAALTLYGVVRRTFLSESLRPMLGRAASSLAGAITLIWLVHPLQTESVTYTIQRGESLMSLFYLLTLYGVIRSDGASREHWWKIGAVVSCTLGMACKPVMVTAPLVTLLYDRTFLVKSWRDIRQRRGWLYAGLAASWLLLPPLLANAPAEWKTSAGFEFKGISPLQYALMESVVVLRYLRLAFWPHPLCLDYGWGRHQWQEMVAAGDLLPCLMVVVALLAGTVWAWNRKPALGFLGAWFFLILAPTSSFIPVADPIAEHRMYLPLAAVVSALVLVAFVLGKKFLSSQPGSVLGWVACGFVVVPLAVVTIHRNRDYISAVAIWDDTVAKCPRNPRAHYNLGFALLQIGQIQEAIRQYKQALQIRPDYAGAHNDLGIALAQAGKIEEAIAHYQQALRINPDYAEAHLNLGNALAQAGKIEEAIAHYEQALRIRPDYTEAHSNLGLALVSSGRVQDAIVHYQQALRIDPNLAEVHYNLGIALYLTGKRDEAVVQYQRVLRIKPDHYKAHYNLGLAFLQEGKVSDAEGEFEQALRIKPDHFKAHYNLGDALVRLGRVTEAIVQYRLALEIDPGNADAHSRLGATLIATGNVHDALGQLEQALRINPELTEAQNNLAWVLATLPPTEGGDPVRAVALAQRACERSANRAPGDLDTLAVAYAAAGRFDAAIATARKAIDLARAAGQAELVNEIEARLELYRNGRTYRLATGATNAGNP